MPKDTRSIRVWLWAVLAMIAAMVVVGGITRLTGSGLSMTEWRPLMGAVPPLDDAAWQAVYVKYQASPQYLQVNHWMTLEDFKRIFFWEYLHRLLGRLTGVVFLVPWIWFLVRRRLSVRLAAQTFVAFLLGGAQGLLGWFMVQSGLLDQPAVSHYRLAAHLGLAFVVGGYVWWLLLGLRQTPRQDRPRLRRWGIAFIALLAAQIVYGAFMAGTRAGYLYHTFPDMHGELVPGNVLWGEPTRNLVAIHFLHRTLGWLVVIAALALGVIGRSLGRPAKALVIVALLQFGLGVLTVVYGVPVAIAVAHQLFALALLCVALWFVYVSGRPRPD